MTIVEVPSPSRSRRPGRRSVDTDLLRVRRLDVDMNAAEFQQVQKHADAAALPLRRWARCTLLGIPVAIAQPAELRSLWAESSTLQSNTNQLMERLNQLQLAGELRLESADPILRELALLAPDLHHLVCQMRVELVALRGAAS